jgi:uncharacterized membrane protein YkvA (DUF1232 family)
MLRQNQGFSTPDKLEWNCDDDLVKRGQAKQMKFLIQPLYNWYRLLLRNSKYRWLVILGSLAYLLSPVDLVTDVIPVVGWLDDGMIATVLVTEVSQILLEKAKANKAKNAKVDTIATS